MPKKPQQQKKRLPISREEIIQEAKRAGLSSLVSQPGLDKYAVLISNSVDNNKVNYLINQIEEELHGKNISQKQHNEILYKNLASYFAQGLPLKDATRATVLDESREGLEKQGFFEKIGDFLRPHKFKGEKYFEKASNAYSDMYDILSQDKVAQKELPELTKAAQTLRMYSFLDVALKNFKVHGLKDDKWYKKWSKELHMDTLESSEKGMKNLETYISSQKEKNLENYATQKAAAGILAFFGAGLILGTSQGITGNAVKYPEVFSGIGSLIGGGILILGLILFLMIKRKERKQKSKNKEFNNKKTKKSK
jgi:hypothetical protein